MSLIITKAKLMEIIKEEIEEALDPHRSLAAQAEDEYEEPKYQGLRAADVLGAGPGEWKTSSDVHGAPQRPPKEYRRQAIQMLAGLMDVDHIRPQDIDVVAWQLYNNAMEGPTRADEPLKKPTLLKRISARLKQIVAEELETYLTEVHSEEQRTYMCTQANLPDSERKKGLSKAQAEEMCHGPMKGS
jgi:hypothetical protein